MSGKKPQLGTEAGRQVALEILTGRRGGRLNVITPTLLSFSNPPTQAECDELARRLLYLEQSYEILRARMDS
jgi:hypothetical protein